MVEDREDFKSKCCDAKTKKNIHGEYYCDKCGQETEAVRVFIRRDLGVY
jgi:Zn finger protein HypA/HybF involved in hydrogenase expression